MFNIDIFGGNIILLLYLSLVVAPRVLCMYISYCMIGRLFNIIATLDLSQINLIEHNLVEHNTDRHLVL